MFVCELIVSDDRGFVCELKVHIGGVCEFIVSDPRKSFGAPASVLNKPCQRMYFFCFQSSLMFSIQSVTL